MRYSEKCSDLTTYWDGTNCVPCELLKGHEVTSNCGRDDHRGVHELPHQPCKPNSFNDGTTARCQPCSSCQPGYDTVSHCSTTTDTRCRDSRLVTSHSPRTTPVITKAASVPNPSTDVILWTGPLTILICILLVVLCVIYMKCKKGQQTVLSYNRRSSYINAGFSALSAPPNNPLEEILSPAILSAPLQTVLDNLDVLEELVILLDPESHGVKNTKHLASQCSFPSNWITYTYSLKDSKSPLKAVLEGLTSRNPEWTVGHLADLLRIMERNDAVAVLAKLRVNGIAV